MAAAGVAATGGPFRPLSADDEEQLPTELESLCMACFRRVRARRGAAPGGAAGLLWARRCRGSRPVLSLSLPAGRHAAPADPHPLLPGGHRRLLRLRQLWLEQRGDPVGRPHPGARCPLRAGRPQPAGGRAGGARSGHAPPPKGGGVPVSGSGRGSPGGACSPPGILGGGGVARGERRAAGPLPQEEPLLTALLLLPPPQDLNRAVVKTDCATAGVPELHFEIPAFSQKGVLTTLEGILDRAIAGLEQDQPDRRKVDTEVAGKIDEFISKLKGLKEVESAFTFILDDPSGNSFVENPRAPQKDDALDVTHYRRTAQQAALLGLEEEEEDPAGSAEDLRNEVLQFSTNCPECNAPASTNMKLVQIPHFKEVIIMATTCEACGHRTNEVKSGGGIEPLGTKMTLHVTGPADMTRDVLKSETCMIEIPELEFELGMGALGGKFTTLEGLLKDIQALVEKNPFSLGDGSCPDRAEKLRVFGRKLQQNLYAPEEDPELCVERYERRFEQNEELGLNDMKTEGYEAEVSSPL
uniref:ZPR1 zinc finger n=1 Tax=Naja naja TaxID=35670 RepID=A0A8C7E1V0_NAJNA